MKRKKKLKHDYKRRQKMLALMSLATVAVGTIGLGQVVTIHADEIVPEARVSEAKEPLLEESFLEEGEFVPKIEEEIPASEGVMERSVSGEGAILIETTEQAAPVVAKIDIETQHASEHEAKGRVSVVTTVEQVEQPTVVTHKLIHKESGEAVVKTETLEKRPHYKYGFTEQGGHQGAPEIDTSTPETTQASYAYFGDVLPGTYRMEISLADLENNPYELDAGSLERIASLPDIVVKPYEATKVDFVEPNLVEVKVDKTQVKRGELVTYTLIYDRSVDADYQVQFKDFTSGFFQDEYHPNSNEKTGRSQMIISGKYYEAGEKKLEFDDHYGYFNREDLDENSWTWKKRAEISQANQQKLAQLTPTVTVLDEEYKHLELISLTHLSAGGSRNELPAHDPAWSHGHYVHPEDYDRFYYNRLVHKLGVGDQLIYKLRLSPDYLQEFKKIKSEGIFVPAVSLNFDRVFDVKELGGTAFEFRKESGPYLHSTNWETGEVDLVFTVQDYMHGYLELGYIGSGAYTEYRSAFGAYLFHIDNPTFALPTFAEIEAASKLFVGENGTVKVKTKDPLPLNTTGSIYLDFDITPTVDGHDSYDYSLYVERAYSVSGQPVETGWLTGTVPGFTEDKIGTYSLKRAKFYNGEGWEDELTNLPAWTLEISGEKVYKSGFLMSREEAAGVGSVTISWVYGSLGRLPKELQNRPLTVQKVQFYDRKGNLLPSSDADWALREWDYQAESRYYYYVPSTGELRELTPVQEDGRVLLKGLKDSQGLYIFARAAESQPSSQAGTSKVLSNQTDDVFVNVLHEDVSAVASIRAFKVTDEAVFEKLPSDYDKANVDMFDIKTLDKDGNFVQIQSDAGAIVILPVAPNRKVIKVIYYLPQTGAVEELAHDWNQQLNQVSFKVSHFSNYAVVYESLAQDEVVIPTPPPPSVSEPVEKPIVTELVEAEPVSPEPPAETQQDTPLVSGPAEGQGLSTVSPTLPSEAEKQEEDQATVAPIVVERVETNVEITEANSLQTTEQKEEESPTLSPSESSTSLETDKSSHPGVQDESSTSQEILSSQKTMDSESRDRIGESKKADVAPLTLSPATPKRVQLPNATAPSPQAVEQTGNPTLPNTAGEMELPTILLGVALGALGVAKSRTKRHRDSE